MRTMVITRDELSQAIEHGIDRMRFYNAERPGLDEAVAALRQVATTAEEVGVGWFGCCPLTLAGITDGQAQRAPKYRRLNLAGFYDAFDRYATIVLGVSGLVKLEVVHSV